MKKIKKMNPMKSYGFFFFMALVNILNWVGRELTRLKDDLL